VLRAATSADRQGRQRDALARARAGETLTVKEHALRHGIDPATASRDLRDLEAEGALRAEGQRRSLRFLLPD
jgi:Fic family protein